ncbi:hypothetical protein J2X34_001906 [Rhodococcus sp. BE178]
MEFVAVGVFAGGQVVGFEDPLEFRYRAADGVGGGGGSGGAVQQHVSA